MLQLERQLAMHKKLWEEQQSQNMEATRQRNAHRNSVYSKAANLVCSPERTPAVPFSYPTPLFLLKPTLQNTHVHARTHALTHAHARTHTHTHTHSHQGEREGETDRLTQMDRDGQTDRDRQMETHRESG